MPLKEVEINTVDECKCPATIGLFICFQNDKLLTTNNKLAKRLPYSFLVLLFFLLH